MAIEAERVCQLLAEQAKQAQVEAGENFGRGGKVTQKIEQPIESEPDRNKRATNSKLAKTFGTNRDYVAKAKKVKDHAPDLLPEIKAENLDLNKATKESSPVLTIADYQAFT